MMSGVFTLVVRRSALVVQSAGRPVRAASRSLPVGYFPSVRVL